MTDVLRRQGNGRLTLSCPVVCHMSLAAAMADELIRLADRNRAALDAFNRGFSILHSDYSREGLAELLDRILMHPLSRFFGIAVPDFWHIAKRKGPVIPAALREHLGQDLGIMMGLTIDDRIFDHIGGHLRRIEVDLRYLDDVIGGVVFISPQGNIVENIAQCAGGVR